MQSYLQLFGIGILSLEILYFLLCIIAQFKSLNLVMIFSTLINLSLLFLLHQSYSFGPDFPAPIHLSVTGFVLFSLLGLGIITIEKHDNRAKKRVATKLPFIGMAIGFYVPAPYVYLSLGLGAIIVAYYFYNHMNHYRLYFRTYFFMLIFSLGLGFYRWNYFLGTFFAIFVIMYLNQLLNLMLVKIYIKEELALVGETK